ncbi:hypothetical protein, conserved [Eimeria brunetti]|uniref:Uncharacterized protein n=1 Tax=Eimeria brunetti TaxID=51314 RepID=U6LAX0_9EIME|nr:hypothetical protein, conserved [Eimeria brunetti]
MHLCDGKILGGNLFPHPARREFQYESESGLAVEDEETPIEPQKRIANRKSRLCSLDLHATSNEEPRHKFNISIVPADDPLEKSQQR